MYYKGLWVSPRAAHTPGRIAAEVKTGVGDGATFPSFFHQMDEASRFLLDKKRLLCQALYVMGSVVDACIATSGLSGIDQTLAVGRAPVPL